MISDAAVHVSTHRHGPGIHGRTNTIIIVICESRRACHARLFIFIICDRRGRGRPREGVCKRAKVRLFEFCRKILSAMVQIPDTTTYEVVCDLMADIHPSNADAPKDGQFTTALKSGYGRLRTLGQFPRHIEGVLMCGWKRRKK